jgi:hypothetical protein
LHPERRGQSAGPLDWKIVAFDAVGLLLFFVPGVIAFAVDFSNGTIYLPPEHHGSKNQNTDARQLVTVKNIPHEQLTVGELEKIISKYIERDFELLPGTYHTEELQSIDEFWAAADRYRARGHRSTS